MYKHKERQQYLYYHPYSGGNWLINSEVGLLYGGIQNSKDFPLCPYLINTVWQYGDSELGGWVSSSRAWQSIKHFFSFLQGHPTPCSKPPVDIDLKLRFSIRTLY